ncbi:BnaA08g07400D [Brassica napus]|uniref:BnaA08g07400D protein n=1 Tax=Brassica napus TaxID=3708 RepID=A0A078IBQ6_BRANA|nr:BnaA08g07400D [Brassica napus]
MADEKYNRKNPAVKRILQEVKEMQANPSDDFMSLPLEENIFEWQFAIRGPADTEFEGGIYHGRIQLPADYPFKPPSFMLLTPNGRFETNTKICLSISNYHPEHWQPSWSVRTALVALIAFMPTSPNGALGSVEYPKEERRTLAIKSREAPPKYGSPERQKVNISQK